MFHPTKRSHSKCCCVVCISSPYLLWRFMSHFPADEQRSQDWHLVLCHFRSLPRSNDSNVKVEHRAVATAGLSCALPRTPEPTSLIGSGAEKIMFWVRSDWELGLFCKKLRGMPQGWCQTTPGLLWKLQRHLNSTVAVPILLSTTLWISVSQISLIFAARHYPNSI